MGKTVLLMDDDQDDLEMLQEALMAIDGSYSIVTAKDGKTGLEKLHQMSRDGAPPCLIVLDLNMPNLNGRDTFVSLKAHPEFSGIPVVIFSTSSSKMDQLFFEKHNTPYFIKPVSYQRLVEAASGMLGHCMGGFPKQ